MSGVRNTQPLDLAIPVLLLPGEPLVAGCDQGPQLAAFLGRLLADGLVQRRDLPPRQPTCQPPGLVPEHVQLAPNDPDASREVGPVHKDSREERVAEVMAERDVGPVESIRHLHQGVLGRATGTVQGWLVPPGEGLLLGGDAEVGDGVDGDDAGGNPVPDRRELADGEHEVATSREAHEPDPGLVDVGDELLVRKDGVDLGLEVCQRAGEWTGGCLCVVEGDDEGVVLVGKDVVPGVVVRGVADDEAPAVDGEQEGQARGRAGLGLAVVGLGEEDAHGQARARGVRLDDGWELVRWAAALPPVTDHHGRPDNEQLHGVDGQRVQDPRDEGPAEAWLLLVTATRTCASIHRGVVVISLRHDLDCLLCLIITSGDGGSVQVGETSPQQSVFSGASSQTCQDWPRGHYIPGPCIHFLLASGASLQSAVWDQVLSLLHFSRVSAD